MYAVANYLIEKTNAYNIDKDSRNKILMSGKRLQKLLYFSDIEYMTHFKKPLIEDFFYAWPSGPVIPIVYTTYIQYQIGEMNPTNAGYELLSYEERGVLDKIFNDTIDITTSALVNISKVNGGPWDSVYNEFDPEHKQIILKEEILDFYYKGSVKHLFDEQTKNKTVLTKKLTSPKHIENK